MVDQLQQLQSDHADVVKNWILGTKEIDTAWISLGISGLWSGLIAGFPFSIDLETSK